MMIARVDQSVNLRVPLQEGQGCRLKFDQLDSVFVSSAPAEARLECVC